MQTSPAVVSAPSPSSHRLSGFTLVELLIATVVLAVGLLALTSAGAAIVKLESHGQQLSRVAAAGETRLELLRAQRCAATSGASSSSRFEERWSVTRSAARTLVILDSIASDGEGGGTSPRTHTFRSAVRC